MALYRCAVCGSSKIVPETKQEGYNKKKGIWGAVLFGGIGALAGTSGNTVTYYHCGDCGAVLNRTMLPAEKESIERCLASPDTFESSLKSYKERYKNIEWEEKKAVIQKAESNYGLIEQDEDCIIQYMKKKGIPVRYDELAKQCEGTPYFAIKTLQDRGVLKCEKIGEDLFYVLVTDIEEMKELALKELAIKKAKTCIHNFDIAIFEKMFSKHDFLTCEEFYNYLKQNNYLSKDVIEAEEKKIFSQEWFSKMCFMEDMKRSTIENRKRKFLLDRNKSVSEKSFGWSNLYILENGGFRRKTEEEIAKETEEESREVQKEVDTLKPIIIALQIAKKATIPELQDMNDDLKKQSNQRLSAMLMRLGKIGIVKRNEMNKKVYFSLQDVSQDEINKILFDAVSSGKIHGFSD